MKKSHLYLETEMDRCELMEFACGQVGIYSRKKPGEEAEVNQDAAALIYPVEGHPVLVVADGMGGGRAGERASALAVEILANSIEDYDAVLALPDVSIERQAESLFNRGASKSRLDPPDIHGAIEDYTALLALTDAPALKCAQALYNRGASKTCLEPVGNGDMRKVSRLRNHLLQTSSNTQQ